MTPSLNDLMNLYAEISAKQDELISLLSEAVRKQHGVISNLLSLLHAEGNADSLEAEAVLKKAEEYKNMRQDF